MKVYVGRGIAHLEDINTLVPVGGVTLFAYTGTLVVLREKLNSFKITTTLFSSHKIIPLHSHTFYWKSKPIELIRQRKQTNTDPTITSFIL